MVVMRRGTEVGVALLLQQNKAQEFVKKYMSTFGNLNPVPKEELNNLLNAFLEAVAKSDPKQNMDISFAIIDFVNQKETLYNISYTLVIEACRVIDEAATDANIRIKLVTKVLILKKFLRRILTKMGSSINHESIISVVHLIRKLCQNQLFANQFVHTNGIYDVLQVSEQLPPPSLQVCLACILDLISISDQADLIYLFTWSSIKYPNVQKLLIRLFIKYDVYDVRIKIHIIWMHIHDQEIDKIRRIVSDKYGKVDKTFSDAERYAITEIVNYYNLELDKLWCKNREKPLGKDSWSMNYLKKRAYQIHLVAEKKELESLDEFYTELRETRVQNAMNALNEIQYYNRTSSHKQLQKAKITNILQCEGIPWPEGAIKKNCHTTYMRFTPITALHSQKFNVPMNAGVYEQILAKPTEFMKEVKSILENYHHVDKPQCDI